MFWTKLKAIAIASALVLVLGSGAEARLGLRGQASAQEREKRAETKPAGVEGTGSGVSSPAEQYQAIVQEYDRTKAAFHKLGENANTRAEREAAFKGHNLPEEDFNPRFLALAERYPGDPVAFDSLAWVLEKTMTYWDTYNQARSDAVARTMEIVTRDHLANPRLGALCLKLTSYPSPRRDQFLRTVALRSSDRFVQGRATLALAQYLKTTGEFVASLKKPGTPQEEKDLLETLWSGIPG